MIIRSFELCTAGGFGLIREKRRILSYISNTFGMARFLWNLFMWQNYTEASAGRLLIV